MTTGRNCGPMENQAPAATPDPAAPLYWAARVERGGRVSYLSASLSRCFVELHGYDHPIVQVRLRERCPGDPPPNAWGWLDTVRPDCYSFVWPSRAARDTCFPYGPESEERLGRGRRVELIVEEVGGAG